MQLELQQANDAFDMPGGNTLENIANIANKERTVALKENKVKYDELIQQAKELGEPIEDIETKRQLSIENIIKQSQQRILEMDRAYLKYRFDLNNGAADTIISNNDVSRIAERDRAYVPMNRPQTERNYRVQDLRADLGNNRVRQDAIYQNLDEAESNLARVSENSNSTVQQIEAATVEVNNLILELQALKEAAQKANDELDDIQRTGKVDSIGGKVLFSGDDWRSDFTDAIDLYGMLASAAATAYNDMASAKQDQLNREISYQEFAIQQAQKLAEQGNTEALKMEEDRLRELKKQQEESAREQQIINSALTLSYAIAAVAKAALEGGGYASIATVAAIIAALGAGYAFVRSFATKGYYDGGYVDGKGGFTGNGGKYQEAGIVHKGEFVFTKETTSKHRELFESIHAGKMPEIPQIAKPVLHPLYIPLIPKTIPSSNKNEMESMKKELRDIKEAILSIDININANQSMNERGLTQMLSKEIRRDRKRF